MKIGITGGIGSGKSYVCHRLTALYGIEVYDCDSAAKRLMRNSPELRRQLTELIGPEAYIEVRGEKAEVRGLRAEVRGERAEVRGLRAEEKAFVLNKAAVARFLLASEENAHAVDAIVHPAVFRDYEQSGLEWMESAIIYESGIYRLVDRVIAVTAPEEVRIERIMLRDGISREKALEWMQRQWPQDRVRQLADFEIVNDGEANIDNQLKTIIEQCNRQF